MTDEAALLSDRQQIVEQTEEAETDAGEQHQRPGVVEAGLIPTPSAPSPTRVPSTKHDRKHDEEPPAGGHSLPAVVRARERRRSVQIGRRQQQKPELRRNPRPNQGARCSLVHPWRVVGRQACDAPLVAVGPSPSVFAIRSPA